MNKKALNQWVKARIPYGYLQAYIRQKPGPSKYKITLIDLVLVSNFKGGSATIAEPEDSLNQKLVAYSAEIEGIGNRFADKLLGKLDGEDEDYVIKLAMKFCMLTKEESTKIDGFGPSYATALLNAYFPDLFPILDKRGLNGAKISNVKTNSQGQVVGIESHYPELIKYFQKRMFNEAKTLQEIDKDLFSIELEEKYRVRKLDKIA